MAKLPDGANIFFFFLGPHLQHVEVPRLGFKLELQLLAATSCQPMPQLEQHWI